MNKYFDNLIRLGLLEASPALSTLTDKKLYEPLKAHDYIQKRIDKSALAEAGFEKATFEEGYMSITDYGKAFCSICLDVPTPPATRAEP